VSRAGAVWLALLVAGAGVLCGQAGSDVSAARSRSGAVSAAAASPEASERAPGEWTVLFYGANDNSSEETVLHDVVEMKRGLPAAAGLELIALLDRSERFSSDREALGDDFSDTRLYRIRPGAAERIEGGTFLAEITSTSRHEANMGDARTLARFVRFGKAAFPARRYALVIYSHGDGRRFAPDESHGGDGLDAVEVAEALDAEASVDLLGLDVCSMGGLENAWRWRPGNGGFSARVLVASASATGPWPYDTVLPRLSDPASVTPADLGAAIVDEIRATLPGHREARHGYVALQSWAAYDLARAAAARDALDGLLDVAGEADRRELRVLRGPVSAPGLVHYGPPGEERTWHRFSYIDLYDLAARAAADPRLSGPVREAAARLAAATDAVVIRSFGGGLYPRFEEGRHGLWVAFPEAGRAHGFDAGFCRSQGGLSPWCAFLDG